MITLSELRSELRLPPDEDDRLATIRAEVIGTWEDLTGRPWTARTGYVEIFEPLATPKQDLLLDLFPVTNVTLVEERPPLSSAWSTLSSSDYFLLGRRNLRRLGSSTTSGVDWGGSVNLADRWCFTTRVTYDGGVSDAPAEVKRALILQARFLIDRTAEEKLITKSQVVERRQDTFEDATFHPFFRELAASKARKA